MVVLFFFRGIQQQEFRSIFLGRLLLVGPQFSQGIVKLPCGFPFLQLRHVLLTELSKAQAIVELSAQVAARR